MISEVATAIRKLRPEFAHLETHPFQQDEAGPSTQPPKLPPATTAPKVSSIIAGPSNAGSSRPNKFHFWYIGTSIKGLLTCSDG
jgi:hypothetical protein